MIIRFGGDDEGFDLIDFEADSAASQFFSNTLQEWKDRFEYPGPVPEELPVGASKVDSVTISLKENYRGVFKIKTKVVTACRSEI